MIHANEHLTKLESLIKIGNYVQFYSVGFVWPLSASKLDNLCAQPDGACFNIRRAEAAALFFVQSSSVLRITEDTGRHSKGGFCHLSSKVVVCHEAVGHTLMLQYKRPTAKCLLKATVK